MRPKQSTIIHYKHNVAQRAAMRHVARLIIFFFSFNEVLHWCQTKRCEYEREIEDNQDRETK